MRRGLEIKGVHSTSTTGRRQDSDVAPPEDKMATPVQAHLIPAHLLPKVSHQQLQALQRCFKENRNPSDLELGIIAAEVGLDEHDVRAWFNHRLACWRQEQGLPANSGSVMD